VLLPVRQLLGAGRNDSVVKAGHGDVTVAVLELPDDPGEGVDGVRRNTSKPARVQVDCGAAGVELEVEESAEGSRERGIAVLVEPAVPNEYRVGLELRPVRPQIFG